MRKASTNVDWVISLGIFLLYIMFLFVFLKPGIHQEYKQEALFDIIESGLYREGSHTLNKIPLYVESDNPGCGEVVCFFPYSWSENSMLVFDEDKSPEASPSLGVEEITFNVDFEQAGEINLFLLHSDKETYGSYGCSLDPLNPVVTECSVGTMETIEGLNEDFSTIITNNCSDYELLKQEWNYPENKEFSIYIGEEYSGICNSGNEPEKESIFVKEFKDIKLGKYEEKEDLLVSMRIW